MSDGDDMFFVRIFIPTVPPLKIVDIDNRDIESSDVCLQPSS